jgi:hypothetical protein
MPSRDDLPSTPDWLTKRHVRIGFALLLVVSLGFLVNGYLTATERGGEADLAQQADLPYDQREQVASPRDGATVITTSSRPGSQAEIVAFGEEGRVLYYNSSFRKFFDVDPVEGEPKTVEYVASRELPKEKCPVEAGRDNCILNSVVRVNLTTGEETHVFDRVTNKDWHDVDRLGEDRLLIADIAKDRVFVVNTTTGLTTWEWDAQSEFSIRSGGFYPDDWTHLNDVEKLDDGRITVSLRNQDQVVFIDPETGMQENWTLGSEDEYSTLYEQHNPDYIPAERGGPALLVADSENNRLVEYERQDGEWVRTWGYTSAEIQWPRDADRLPNGHTLVTDSNGRRVFEVNQQGEIVWEVPVDTPYESERLGTGDESTGGETARELGLPTVGDVAVSGDVEVEQKRTNPSRQLWTVIRDSLPSLLVNGVVFVMPAWIGFRDVLTVVGMVGIAGLWVTVECYWSAWTLRWPLTRRRD